MITIHATKKLVGGALLSGFALVASGLPSAATANALPSPNTYTDGLGLHFEFNPQPEPPGRPIVKVRVPVLDDWNSPVKPSTN